MAFMATASGAEVGQMRWSQVALSKCEDAYRLTRNPWKTGFTVASPPRQHCCGPGCRGFESLAHPIESCTNQRFMPRVLEAGPPGKLGVGQTLLPASGGRPAGLR